MESELADRGLVTTRSEANFSWASVGEEAEDAVLEGLATRGVIVRGGTALGAPGHFRVTYGTRAENDRFLEALDAALAPV